jgi:hypothetical protein
MNNPWEEAADLRVSALSPCTAKAPIKTARIVLFGGAMAGVEQKKK